MVTFSNGEAINRSNSEASNLERMKGRCPCNPVYLFGLTQKVTKKVKAAFASHEKLRLTAKIFQTCSFVASNREDF